MTVPVVGNQQLFPILYLALCLVANNLECLPYVELYNAFLSSFDLIIAEFECTFLEFCHIIIKRKKKQRNYLLNEDMSSETHLNSYADTRNTGLIYILVDKKFII